MKRSIDYRLEQKVKHGEAKEITFISPYETITFKYEGNDSDNVKKPKHIRKQRDYDYMQEAMEMIG